MTHVFTLSLDPRGRLTLHRAGTDDVSDVRIRRAFPWSAPERYISIRNAEGKEILLIEDPTQLDPDLQKLITQVLADGSFIPRIQRVLKVDVSFGYQEWTVHTDRGEIAFRVLEREDIRFMTDGRFSVKDADGNIYELPKLEDLDHTSQRAIQALL